jgi:hypothetical protein
MIATWCGVLWLSSKPSSSRPYNSTMFVGVVTMLIDLEIVISGSTEFFIFVIFIRLHLYQSWSPIRQSSPVTCEWLFLDSMRNSKMKRKDLFVFSWEKNKITSIASYIIDRHMAFLWLLVDLFNAQLYTSLSFHLQHLYCRALLSGWPLPNASLHCLPCSIEMRLMCTSQQRHGNICRIVKRMVAWIWSKGEMEKCDVALEEEKKVEHR